VEAIILLADSAQTDATSGKVHALGMGWSVTSTPTPQGALVVIIHIPWDQTNRQHPISIRLLDADGRPVTPDGMDQPLALEGYVEAGRPPGVLPGTAIDQNLALSLPPMNLTAGQAYEWRLEIDGLHQDSWSARFYVRPAAPTA
jgi:hypothetical protein